MTHPRETTVLHVITALNHGGAEAMLAKLLLASRRRQSCQRHLVLSMMSLGVVGQQLCAQGVPVHSLGMRQGRPSLRGLWRLLALVRKLHPDIIQGWMYHGNIAAWVARQFGCRSAMLSWNIRHSLHDLARERRGSALAIKLGARLSGGADVIIFNSRAAIAQHRAIGFDDRSALLIPNGFDTELFRPDRPARSARAALAAALGIAPQTVLVGMIARVHPMKDHAGLFAALEIVRAAGHDAHLLLAGAGTDPLPAPLAADLAARLPADRVSCLGDRRDIAEWLPGLDIAVLSSAWGEAFPNVLGEALAAGVPCVATDVGDSAEIVGAGGLCVSPGDPKALAAALVRLIEAGPLAREAMGARGRKSVVERYALDRIVRQYEDLYQSMWNERLPNGVSLASQEEPSCAA